MCSHRPALTLGATSAILWSEVWATNGSIQHVRLQCLKTSIVDLEPGSRLRSGATQNIVGVGWSEQDPTPGSEAQDVKTVLDRPRDRRFRRIHRPDSQRTHTVIARGHGPATARLGQPCATSDRIYRTRLRGDLVSWRPASKRSKPPSLKTPNERRPRTTAPLRPGHRYPRCPRPAMLVAAADAGRYRGIAEAALKELAAVSSELGALREECLTRFDTETLETLGVLVS